MKNANELVGMITLYGTSQIGAGWLAMAKGDEKPMGTGTPRDGRTFTEAVWAAVELSPAALVLLEMGLEVHADWCEEPEADPDSQITGPTARKLAGELEALRAQGGVQ